MRRILTIDGGGVRGIIPAVLLAELERPTGRLKAYGEPLASAVDWPAILDGRDERYRVSDATTLPREYCRLGPA